MPFTPFGASAGKSSVFVTDYGAVAGTDSTAAIQAAFNATPAGGVCYLDAPPGAALPYLVSATLIVPNNISVFGPPVTRPGKPRSANPSTTPVLRAVNGSNLNAVLSDTAYTSVSSTPAPSQSILLRGVVVDGNAAGQSSGAGHGIALMGSAHSIETCQAQNTLGAGIVYADQSAAGFNLAAGTVENGVYRCNVYQAGTFGIWVQSNNQGSTDGYIYDNIIDHNFLGTGPGVKVDKTAGWRVCYNHAYAQPGDGFHLYICGPSWIEGNFSDNFGQNSIAATTYRGFDFSVGPSGRVHIHHNNANSNEAHGGGAGNFTYYNINAQSASQVTEIDFSGNSVRQTTSTSGTTTGYAFNAGGSGTQTIFGIASPLTVNGPTVKAIPTILNGPSFPDFSGPTASFSPAQPTGTASQSMVMAGIGSTCTFTPSLTGKAIFRILGIAGTATAVVSVSLQGRYGTGAAPANGAAPAGNTFGPIVSIQAQAATATGLASFTLEGVVTGLTPGTQYWLDFSFLTATAADVANASSLTVIAQEVQ